MDRGVHLSELFKVFVFKKWKRLRPAVSELAAVNGVTLSIPAGQSVALIGPNGAGKSTIMKMLTGILRPSSGEASVAGFVPWRDRRRLAYHIGTVFGQRSQLWYHLAPADSFDLLRHIYGLDRLEFARTRDSLIDRFDLGEFMGTPVRKLSLGQRMRAEVAASLLHRPRVLFLDEPTIGLDVIARRELRNLIREWNRDQGVTVCLTSHDAGDIEEVSSRVVVINHGQVVVDSTIGSLRRMLPAAKVLRVQFHAEPRALELPGVELLHRGRFELKLRVDPAIIPIARAIANIFEWAPVRDIAVEDPRLEDVIAHIYTQA